MGHALELISGSVTAPSSTETTLTAYAGNSYTVRAAKDGTPIWLIGMWGLSQASGIRKVRSARMHDNVQGIRFRTVATQPQPLIPWGRLQPLYPNDLLIDSLSGSATAGDIEIGHLLIYYEDLPGVDARLMMWDEVKQKIKNILTIEQALTAGTSGGYSGEQAITADIDVLKAGTDYALLGYTTNVAQSAFRIRGADTGNLGIGMPGDAANHHYTRKLFVTLSEQTGLPCIPIINSDNKSNTLFDTCNNENAASPVVSLIVAELAK